MSLKHVTTKFQEILMSGFRGVVLTICFSSIYFGQISKFKKGVISREKIDSKFPVDMHIYTVTLCPSLLQRFRKLTLVFKHVT